MFVKIQRTFVMRFLFLPKRRLPFDQELYSEQCRTFFPSFAMLFFKTLLFSLCPTASAANQSV